MSNSQQTPVSTLNIQGQKSEDVEGKRHSQDDNRYQKDLEEQTRALAMDDMGASPILLTINKIRDENTQRSYNSENASVLPSYQVDRDDVRRLVGIQAEINADCLDRGSDLTEASYYIVWREGVFPGDDMVHVIGKRLGGPGHTFNIVPLNSKLDLSAWKDNEDVIYNHVKLNHTARLLFAFEYDDESNDEFCRPIKIYYHFDLYDENGKKIDKVMEGIINNISPRA